MQMAQFNKRSQHRRSLLASELMKLVDEKGMIPELPGPELFQLMRDNGIQLTWMAEKLGFVESNLRYHLSRANINKEIRASIVILLSKVADNIQLKLGLK